MLIRPHVIYNIIMESDEDVEELKEEHEKEEEEIRDKLEEEEK
jgi:hypothetical protein